MDFYLKHKPGNMRNSEGAFVKLKDGRFLCAYTQYYGDTGWDHSPANIAGIYSSDNGRTWSEPEILVHNDALNVMSVSLLRLQDGRIAMVYLKKTQLNGCHDVRPYIIFSADETKTWTEPVSITNVPAGVYGVNNDRLVQLKNGRLILPSAYYRYLPGSTNVPSHRQGITTFFLSDDSGATWRESKQCVYPPQWLDAGLAEPGVVELNDGTIFGWARTNGGCQYKFFSHDGGETWTEPQAAREFLSPESPLSMKRNPKDGCLYAIWNFWEPKFMVRMQRGSWGRTPLVIARNTDEGRWNAWTDWTVIEDSPYHGFCYIAMEFNGDELLLEYCCGGMEDFCLQDSKIKVLDLTKMNKGYPDDDPIPQGNPWQEKKS